MPKPEAVANFTPGPWGLQRREYPDNKETYVTQAGKYDLLASTYADSSEEQIANARLIAAAPEMYEALKAMLTFGAGIGARALAEHQARAAIAKAEGRT